MEPVPTEFISPFLEHPTLVTPFEPTISSVDTFQPNQTSVTTIGDVYTYFSPIESIPTPLSDGYVDDSEPASLSYSERNDEGTTKPGHVWCCKKWHKTGAISRHMKTKKHNPKVICKASRSCKNREAQQRDMYRHYWIYHEQWAKDNEIPSLRRECEECGKSFTRKDFLKRHIDQKSCHGSAENLDTRSPGSRRRMYPLLPKDDTQ